MPCYDPDTSYSSVRKHEIEPLKKELAQVEAMLCAIVNVLVENKMIIPVVEAINTEEAGVTPNDIAIWWNIHKEKDEERKAMQNFGSALKRNNDV